MLAAALYTTAGMALAACAAPLTREAGPQALEEASTSTTPATVSTPTVSTPAATPAQATSQPSVQLDATPACGDDDDPTPAQTEGPYYTPDTPARASLLEPDMVGTRLLVAGYVLTTDCRPLGGALLDFWQADDAGVYDNAGYRLRGHQFTDDAGRYQLETIVPGLYPGRTRHIHVRVQPSGGAILTTQLYFPDEPQNARDGIFRPELIMAVRAGEPLVGTFDFVLDS
ncbi:MAG: hypothetical protein WDZ49_03300 [Litorilinea sp.]